MKNTPLVSIALCVYNGEKFLEEQLHTLLYQTYSNIEIVISDDGSTDGSLNIIKKYLSDQRVKLFKNEHNLGYVKNFEKVIQHCKGDYIALSDQDDIWDLTKIETLLGQIGNATLIYHDSTLIDTGKKELGKISGLLRMYQGDNPFPLLFYNCVSGHSCMFKKTLVPHLGAFNSNFYHDWWIAFVAGNMGKIKYIDQALVKYRQHHQSSTDIMNRKRKSNKPGPKYEEINVSWLKNCLRFNGRYQKMISRIVYLLENKSFINSLWLFWILAPRWDELHFLKRRNSLSNLNYLRKMVFYNPQPHLKLETAMN
jgi:glycosyltransferase involved in cell wall biosynthesis